MTQHCQRSHVSGQWTQTHTRINQLFPCWHANYKWEENKKFLINVSDKSLIELPLGARRFDILILAASRGRVSQGGLDNFNMDVKRCRTIFGKGY